MPGMVPTLIVMGLLLAVCTGALLLAMRNAASSAETPAATPEMPPRQQRLISMIVLAGLVFFIIGPALLYSQIGSPHLPDSPLAMRQEEISQETRQTMLARNSRLEMLKEKQQAAAAEPTSLQALLELAEAAAEAGDSSMEQNALRKALALLPASSIDRPTLQAMLAEALTRAAEGTVTAPALALIEQALSENKAEPRARLLLGLARIQAGADAEAVTILRQLATDTAGTPAFNTVIALLRPVAERTDTDISDLETVQTSRPADGGRPDEAAILAMVENLRDRLYVAESDSPIDPQINIGEWMMLARAEAVLGNIEGRDHALKRLLAESRRMKTPEALQIIISGLNILIPPDAIPETLPAMADAYISRGTELAVDAPMILFFSGLQARNSGQLALARERWQKLADSLQPDDPLKAMLASEISKLAAMPN